MYRDGCGETQRAEPEKIAAAALHYGNFQRAKFTIANGELIHLVDLNKLNFVVEKEYLSQEFDELAYWVRQGMLEDIKYTLRRDRKYTPTVAMKPSGETILHIAAEFG